jgi:hypothetical protein
MFEQRRIRGERSLTGTGAVERGVHARRGDKGEDQAGQQGDGPQDG